MRSIKIFSVLGFFLVFWVFSIQAKKPVINTNEVGYALGGYDPVAYFIASKALKGNKKYKYKWKNVTWLFSSKKHLNLFKKKPKKYAPQYGGYCAFAVSHGYVASVDPQKSWGVYKGKLYLAYNKKVWDKWSSDKGSYIKKANKNWPKALEKDSPR